MYNAIEVNNLIVRINFERSTSHDRIISRMFLHKKVELTVTESSRRLTRSSRLSRSVSNSSCSVRTLRLVSIL